MPDIVAGLVSTIIPVYNRPEMVLRAIDSVLAQTHRPIEIIVVDDGSTDSTYDVLVKKAHVHDGIVVLQQDNAGPGVAREKGRKIAKGEYIQYLDSDDTLLPDKFSVQIAALETSGADISYGKTELVSDIGDSTIDVSIRATGEYREQLFPYLLHERWWFTATPLFTRKIVDKAIGWLPLINEEDWAYESGMGALSAKLTYSNQLVARHFRHTSHLSAEGSTNAIKLQHRSIAKRVIYNNAKKVAYLFSEHDWKLFSKSVFLLARQCAKAGLLEEMYTMIELSIEANGSVRLKHRFFMLLVRFAGPKRAACLIEFLTDKPTTDQLSTDQELAK